MLLRSGVCKFGVHLWLTSENNVIAVVKSDSPRSGHAQSLHLANSTTDSVDSHAAVVRL